MYRYSNGQISLADFKQPVGMNLKESNRWVKKAQTIPWLEIEKRYAALFTNRKGNVAKPLRLALGACIIQAEYGFSDEETALMIQENPYLQYFCGYPGYDDEKLPFDPSLMVYFRKRLTPEVLGEINEMIIQDAKERQEKEAKSRDDDDDSGNHPGTGRNSGTMIVDATCAPSNIRYPQDVSLLNEARENAEALLDDLHDPADGKKPRTYRKRARKDYLKYTRCRKHTAKMTRKAIGKQLTYLRRDLDAIDGKLPLGKTLTTRQMERLDTIRTIYEQQKYMYDNHTHSVPDRIVSVSQPFVRPIVRGKAGKPVEFGAKLDISVVDGHGWNAAPLTPTMKLGICRRWRNGSGSGKGIIQAAFWQTRSTETVRISVIARNTESGYPVRHWDVLRRVRPETRLRITGMSASVWKWSASSVWQSENAAWDWSPLNCGKPPPM